jgi:nuclear pore complex protein Nup98-Nup96
LRVADYNGGRRFGNGSGQAGAFGQTNFSGGFGQQNNAFGQPQNTTGTGLFGQPAATPTPAFGGTQPAQTGFGTTAGGLFGGQNKPAAGGLFGNASSGASSGGLFGTAGNGFGSGTTNTTNSFGGAGGLFGQQNNNQSQQPTKPLFGGGTNTTTGGFGSGGTGFGTGNASTTSGSIFGGGQTNNPFGQPQQNQTSNPFPGFNQTNQTQNNTTPAFGGFGQTQQQDQKPGGLFGTQPSTNTGGGLFGTANSTQQQNTGGLFGNTQNNNQASTGSLFGQKPAATTSLFGNTNANTSNTGGGLFGGLNNNTDQNQQNSASSLFGGNNSQQQKPSLFGGTQQTTSTGGGLFGGLGGSNNQQQGGNSLFGGNNQQQQPAGGLFGGSNNQQGSSLFNTQQAQQPNAFASPPALNNSLLDPGSAYGSPSIFSGLPPPPVHVGPLATPINVKQKMKKSTILPHYKMTPNAGSRMVTPQKRGGFGFSYSTYGTPASASSNASTPGGLGSSLLYGSLGRGLGKSLSTSNLRRNFDSDGESVLTPGAFSAGSSRYGGAGSLKRLTIDRSLRTDLFGDKATAAALPNAEKNDASKGPGILKKKVSFDSSALGGNPDNQNNLLTNGENNSDKENSATPSAEEQGLLRTPSRGRALGSKTNGAAQQPEMEQVPRGNELAIVHEDASPESSNAPPPRAPPKSQEDQQPEAYWMKPSEEQINRMTQDEKRKVQNYSVGRKGCGHVEFNAPVDLSRIPLNDIYGNIVCIELRSITVYPDQSNKPPQGQGLNVPSTLYLENSWPRSRDRKTTLHEKSGPRFQKHVDRLRKVGGTEFVRYEKDTGTWVFKVPHFTTYGFDYDDDASEGDSLHASVQDEGLESSILSEAPDTPTPKSRLMRNGRTPTATNSTQRSFASTNESSNVSSSPDDTFQFRKKKMSTPGAFDKEPTYEEEEPAYDDVDHEMEDFSTNGQSFLGKRSAASPSDSGEDEPSDIGVMGGVLLGDQSLVIHNEDDAMDMGMAGAFPSPEDDEVIPKLGYGTPVKTAFNSGGEWAEALQRTISPRKQDRQALRETQAHVLEHGEVDLAETPTAFKKGGTPKMATSIDLMNSLFGMEQARKSGRNAKKATNGKGLKV